MSGIHTNHEMSTNWEKTDWILSALVFILSFSIFLAMTLLSEGVVEIEVYYHYFSAKYLMKVPLMFIHHYSRPLFTSLTFLLIQAFPYGIKSYQSFDCVVSAVTCSMLYATTKIVLGRRAYSLFAAAFILGCPLFFTYAYSGLVEPFFALLLLVALYLYYRKSYLKSVLLISLDTLVRLEGFILLPVWTLFVFKRFSRSVDRLRGVLVLFLGPFFWMFASTVLTGDPIWPLRMYLADNVSGSRTGFPLAMILDYPMLFFTSVGAISIVLFMLGFWFSMREKRNRMILIHVSILPLFLIISFLTLFSYNPNTQTINYDLPELSVRLFVDVLPLSVIISSYGAESLWTKLSHHFSSLTKVAKHTRKPEAAFLVFLIVLHVSTSFVTANEIVRMVPQSLSTIESVEKQVGEYLAMNFRNETTILYCTNPTITFYLDLNCRDAKLRVLTINTLKTTNPMNKSVIVWDSIYAGAYEGVPYFSSKLKYRYLATFVSPEFDRDYFVVNIFQYDESLVNDISLSVLETSDGTQFKIYEPTRLSINVSSNNLFDDAIKVGFWVDEVCEDNVIGLSTVSFRENTVAVANVTWMPTQTGTHLIFIIANFDKTLPEYDENNNYSVIEIVVVE